MLKRNGLAADQIPDRSFPYRLIALLSDSSPEVLELYRKRTLRPSLLPGFVLWCAPDTTLGLQGNCLRVSEIWPTYSLRV